MQVIVLTRVIAENDAEQVTLTAEAIRKLSELLLNTNTSLVTQIGNFERLCSLCTTMHRSRVRL